MVAAGFRGADVVALRALAGRLGAASGRLTEMSATTTRALHRTSWYGSDADAFRSDWASRWRPALGAVADALDRAGHRLTREADQQDRASDAGAAASGAPAGGAPVGAATGDAGPVAGSSAWARTAGEAWRAWQSWYGRLGTAVGVAPYAVTALRWPDAPRVGPKTWTALADQWSRVHLPSTGFARTLGVLNWASIAADGYQSVAAASRGNGVEALEHGIPAVLGVGTAAPVPAVRLVSLAGSVGWTIGSWIEEPINNSEAGIWVGDHIIGPAGDGAIGAWHASERAIAGAWQQATRALSGEPSSETADADGVDR